MGVRVHVGSQEDLRNALKRFKRLVQLTQRWEKRYKPAGQRGDAFRVKPSEVRSKREHVRRLRAAWAESSRGWQGRGRSPPPVWAAPPPDPPRRWERGSGISSGPPSEVMMGAEVAVPREVH